MKLRDLFVSIGFDVDDQDLKNLDRGIDGLKTNLRRVAVLAAGAGAAMGFFLKYGGEFEQTNVAFETMLGSAEKARKLLDELAELGLKSPFTLPEVEQNAKLLLGMGIEAKKTTSTMKMMGDVSAGLSVPLWRLALNYGQVRVQNRLTGRELRDFAVAGVPLLDELAKMLGKSKAEVLQMVSAGKIGFPLVEKAFRNMTSGSGKFADLMAKQAKTLFGITSNIKDLLIKMAREIGMRYLPQAKKWASWALSWLEKSRTKIVNLTGDFRTFIRIVKTAAIVLAGLIGAQVLAGLGFMMTGIIGLANGFRMLGNRALWAQVKMLALPLVIIGLLAGVVLVIQDIYSYFTGKDSLTGRMFDFFQKELPENASIGMKVFKWFYEVIKTAAIFAAMLYTQIEMIFRKVKNWSFDKLERMLEVLKGITDTIKELWENRRKILWDLQDEVKAFVSDLPGGKMVVDFLTDNLRKKTTFPQEWNRMVNEERGRPGQARTSAAGPTAVTMNAPVSVTVPPGTHPEKVGPYIQDGIRDALGEVIRNLEVDTTPQVSY